MSFERAGAFAIVAGTLLMMGVMALHPTGIPHGPSAGHVAFVGVAVHAVAIAAAPLMTFGFFALTRNIGFSNVPATLALFFYAFGSVMVVLAAAMSGLIATRLIAAQAVAGADQAMIHELLRLEWYMNQAFATLHVGFFSAAITLWALAWPGKGILAAAIQMTGLLVGIGVFAWLVSGTLTLNVHGMGARWCWRKAFG